MEAAIVDDELWTLIEPLLPSPKPRCKKNPGRVPVLDRAAHNGIQSVFKTGFFWNHLPTKLGFGLCATSWRRLREWRNAGVWDRLHALLLAKLREVGQFDFSRAAVASSSVRALRAGAKLVRTQQIVRPGSKRQILTDANGVPVSVILTGVNRNDVTQLLPLVAAIPPIRGVRGRSFQKPKIVHAYRGYDSEPDCQSLRDRDIKPAIVRRRSKHGSGFDKFRWFVERTHSRRHNFRRIRIRLEHRVDIHELFLKFCFSLVCWNIFTHADLPF